MPDNTSQNIRKEEPDLYKRSIRGGYWVIASQISLQAMGFLKTLFIAHYFYLNDLGIISAAVMMMDILNTFTQTGFESALIQKKGDIREYLNTAWTAGILKGAFLCLVLFISAPFFASLKIPAEKIPLATGVFRVMSFSFLISGFRNIGAVYFNKNLEFHKSFLLSIISQLSDIFFSIILVLIFRNIWGFIAARLITSCVACLNTYLLSSYRPRLGFQRSKARELWGYGRWIFGSHVLGYLLEAGDDYFVWFYLGIKPLALYRYAFKFAMMPTTHISQVISKVTFPAYSKIQNDRPRLQAAYLKVMHLNGLLSVPVAFLIFILGPDFVRLFLPERMHAMTHVLQILAIVGLITSMGSTGGPVLKAIGILRPILYLQWIRLLLLALLIYPLTKIWGIAGTAGAIASVRLAMYFPSLYIASRLLQCPYWKLFRPLLVPFTASCMMLAVLLLKFVWVTENGYFMFFTLLFCGLVVYTAGIWMLDSLFDAGLRNLVIEQAPALRKFRKRNENSN